MKTLRLYCICGADYSGRLDDVTAAGITRQFDKLHPSGEWFNGEAHLRCSKAEASRARRQAENRSTKQEVEK